MIKLIKKSGRHSRFTYANRHFCQWALVSSCYREARDIAKRGRL